MGLSTSELVQELRRREHEAAEEEMEEATNATELRKRCLTKFDDAMAAELKRQSEKLLKLGRDDVVVGAIGDEAEKAILSVFESLSRVARDAGRELQDADKAVARVELKAQHSTDMSKLKTSRSAAAVSLNATKVEMDAAATKMLEEKVEAMRESDGRQLEKAQAELLELGQAHDALVMAHKTSEEALKTANQLQRSTAREMKAAEKQYAELKRDAAAANQALDAALNLAARVPNTVTIDKEAPPLAATGGALVATQKVADATSTPAGASAGGDTFRGFRKFLAASDSSGRARGAHPTSPTPPHAPSRAAAHDNDISSTLREQGSSTATAANKANSVVSVGLDGVNNEERTLTDRVSAVVGALEAACGQRDSATASLEEASHEADRAAMMHVEECKRLTGALAVKLRDDVEAVRNGEREAAESQLGRLYVEMRAMAAMHAETDGELKRVYEVLRERLGPSELAEENKRLKTDVLLLTSETEEARKQVDGILSQLNFAIDEKKSLSEALQELVERYECAETEIRVTKATLDEALSNLDSTRYENASLSAQVKQLVDDYGSARDELAKSKHDVAEALVSLGVQFDTNRALDEQVASLLEKLNELAIEADTGRVLSREVEDIRTRLHFALAKVSALTSTKLSLREQVDELVDKHGVALERVGNLEKLDGLRAAALAKSEKQYRELTQSAKDFEVRVMTHAESMVHKVQDEARFKRAELVEAAMSSLNELRLHLTHTASGQRLTSKEYDFNPLAKAAVSSKEVTFHTLARPGRWGSLPAQTKFERLVVTIREPDVGDVTGASMDLAVSPPSGTPVRARAKSQDSPSPPKVVLRPPSAQSVGASPRAQRARAKSNDEYHQAVGEVTQPGPASPTSVQRTRSAGTARAAMRRAQQVPRPSTAPEPGDLSPPAWPKDAFNMGHNPMYRLSPEPTSADLGLLGAEKTPFRLMP